ncbi:MAG: hypothetical protein ACLQVD_20310 [Capsulimonadaceae bacterium]
MNEHQQGFVNGLCAWNPARMSGALQAMIRELFDIEPSKSLTQQTDAQCALLLWAFLLGGTDRHDVTVDRKRTGLCLSTEYVGNGEDVLTARLGFEVRDFVPKSLRVAWSRMDYAGSIDLPRDRIACPVPLFREEGWTSETPDQWKRPYDRAIQAYIKSLREVWTPITSSTQFSPSEWDAAWGDAELIRVSDDVLGRCPDNTREFLSRYRVPATIEIGILKVHLIPMSTELEPYDELCRQLAIGEIDIDGGVVLVCLIDSVTGKLSAVCPDDRDDRGVNLNRDLETFLRCLLTAFQWQKSVDSGGGLSPKNVKALRTVLQELDLPAVKSANTCFWSMFLRVLAIHNG